MSRQEWEQATAALKRPRQTPAKSQANLELPLALGELAPPASGNVVDVADIPELAMPEARNPSPITRLPEGQALRDFQSTLTNTDEERQQHSNLLGFWERVPTYNCGDIMGITSSADGKNLPIVHYDFEEAGLRYKLTLTPAQIEVSEKGVTKSMYCYPDTTDELVELALVKIAQESGDWLTSKGAYGVHFTLNQLMDMLKSWGRGRSYPAIRRSLDVLHKCNVKISSYQTGGHNNSGPILPTLRPYNENGFDRRDRNGFWTAQFHPIVSAGIAEGLYQQYNLYRAAMLKSSVAHSVAKLIVIEGRNISPNHPYRLTFSRFRELTGMLNYKSRSHALRKFRTDVHSLIKHGFLSDVTFEDVKRGKRIVDTSAVMYGSERLTKEMKASHRRNALLEQRRLMRQAIEKSV